MADSELFKDLKVIFHWSEADILDRNGTPYEEEQELTGTKAYDFLCLLITEDKKAWNRKILGHGYEKTKISVSYKDFNFNQIRVDLGDMEFGIHSSVAESLRTRFSSTIRYDLKENAGETLKEFDAVIDEFSKDEVTYLKDNEVLQEKLNLEPITYLYCASQKEWEAVDSVLHKYYVETVLPMEDKMHFFSKDLPVDPVYIRSTKRPEDRMEKFGETTLRLLVPKREQEMLDGFEHDFTVESRHTYVLGDFYDEKRTGFAALNYLNDRMEEDYSLFRQFTGAKYYAPDERFYLKISYQGNELGVISYDRGSGDCMRQCSEVFAQLCKNDPLFKATILTQCKYHTKEVYHMDILVQGLDDYTLECLKVPLPDKETSLKTLKDLKPEVPDKNTRSYDVSQYFAYIQKIAIASLPDSSWDPVPSLMTRQMANDNIGLRDAKALMKEGRLSNFEKELYENAYKTDPETKKILKMRKTLNTGR